MNYKIKTIEAGYAKVVNATGHTIGTLCQTGDYSSTRTGTDWIAVTPGKRRVACESTRDAAAAKLIAWREAQVARLAAEKEQS
jgi:hypothetical protein